MRCLDDMDAGELREARRAARFAAQRPGASWLSVRSSVVRPRRRRCGPHRTRRGTARAARRRRAAASSAAAQRQGDRRKRGLHGDLPGRRDARVSLRAAERRVHAGAASVAVGVEPERRRERLPSQTHAITIERNAAVARRGRRTPISSRCSSGSSRRRASRGVSPASSGISTCAITGPPSSSA